MTVTRPGQSVVVNAPGRTTAPDRYAKNYILGLDPQLLIDEGEEIPAPTVSFVEIVDEGTLS